MSKKIIWATIYKTWLTQMRAYPISFMTGCILTAFYSNLSAWFLYHYLFHGNLKESFIHLSKTKDYMTYVIVGGLIYLFVVRTCLNVSRTLITELREGTFEGLMLAPFQRISYFSGNMILQILTTAIESFLAGLFGVFFGLHFTITHPWYLCISILNSLLAFWGISMILGCIMLYTRDTYISQNTFFTIIFLVCGITFPYQYLPFWIQWLSKIIPVTDAVYLIRSCVMGNIVRNEFAFFNIRLFLCGMFYVCLGFFCMKKIEKKAIEKMEV